MSESYEQRAQRVSATPRAEQTSEAFVVEFKAVERETLGRVSAAIEKALARAVSGSLSAPRALQILALAVEVVLTGCTCRDVSTYPSDCPEHGAEWLKAAKKAAEPVGAPKVASKDLVHSFVSAVHYTDHHTEDRGKVTCPECRKRKGIEPAIKLDWQSAEIGKPRNLDREESEAIAARVAAAEAEIAREDAEAAARRAERDAADAPIVAENARRAALPSFDPDHYHGIRCDGDDHDGHCQRLRRKLFGKGC